MSSTKIRSTNLGNPRVESKKTVRRLHASVHGEVNDELKNESRTNNRRNRDSLCASTLCAHLEPLPEAVETQWGN